MKYQIEKCFGKYTIHKTGEDVPGKYGLYLSKVKKDGSYEWVSDYSIAKTMTLATAKKHLTILEK